MFFKRERKCIHVDGCRNTIVIMNDSTKMTAQGGKTNEQVATTFNLEGFQSMSFEQRIPSSNVHDADCKCFLSLRV